MLELMYAGLAARGVGYLVAEATVFAGWRQRIKAVEVRAWLGFLNGGRVARWPWLPVAKIAEGLTCPVCVGFWAALKFTWGDGVAVWMAAGVVQLVLAELSARFRSVDKQTSVTGL